MVPLSPKFDQNQSFTFLSLDSKHLYLNGELGKARRKWVIYRSYYHGWAFIGDLQWQVETPANEFYTLIKMDKGVHLAKITLNSLLMPVEKVDILT